jgi:hypothetical protein
MVILIFILFICHFAISKECLHEFFIYSLNGQQNNSTFTNENDYTFLDNSKNCDNFLNELLPTKKENIQEKSLIPNCTDDLIEVDLIPYSVFPDGENM